MRLRFLIQGQLESDLNDVGRQQAKAVSESREPWESSHCNLSTAVDSATDR